LKYVKEFDHGISVVLI